jgi:transcriptional regulator with XRE-family HTH domain
MILKTPFFGPSDAQTHIRDAARRRRIAMNITQTDLADRSGVPLASLKRFEQTGQVSLTALLRIAASLNALDGFGALFPQPEPRTLDDLERGDKPRQRASGRSS